jgi:hypothetical protein
MKQFVSIFVVLLLFSISIAAVVDQYENSNSRTIKNEQIIKTSVPNSIDTLTSIFQYDECVTGKNPHTHSENCCDSEYNRIQLGIPTCDHWVYFSVYNGVPSECWIYESKLNGGNLTCICYGGGSMNFFSSGTWTNYQQLLVVEYNDGNLYEIDLDSCGAIAIGGGGVGLNGLTYDPTTQTLYGCSSYDLYKIDPDTGEQELIGPFNTGTTMIEIACDAEGVMYGWDVKYSGNSILFKIDKETGEATAVGSMGMTLLYAQDGDFCRVCDILYLAAYIYSPEYGQYLVECDEDTGECTIIGSFEMGVEGFFVIPSLNLLPLPEFNWTPTIPEPGETITFNASESIDPDGYIKVYEWDWDNDGVFDYKNYSSPIATHIFEEAGFYPVTLRVKDNNFTTNTITKTVRVGNQPPNPPIIEGSINGTIGITYDYSFITTDDDGDNLSYFVKWGDGTDSGWLGPYPSGFGISLNHSWDEEGTFNISSKAKDIHGKESDWSYFDVTMPKNYINHWWMDLLNKFLLLSRLLWWLNL